MRGSAPASDQDTLVVGFDLGHGETALAIAHAGRTTPPAVLDFPGSSRRQLVTAVARDADGAVLIGELAVGTPDILVLHVGFKSAQLTDPATRQPMRMFIGKVVEETLASNLVPATGVRWVFGAPSGWQQHQYAEYKALLAEAGLTDVEIVPESRAALLYARDSGEVRTNRKRVTERVLIVDIGSSTTDYTFVSDLVAKPVDHGNVDLGAALIDRRILDRVVSAHPCRAELEELFAVHPHSRRQLELACRKAKEEYFRTPAAAFAGARRRVGVIHVIDLLDGREEIVDVRLSPQDMDDVLDSPQQALGNRSWRAAFAEDVAAAVTRSGSAVDMILLTGGPSRMAFVADICRDLVGSDRVVLGSEPEVAIARGLALAGRMGVRAAGFRADVAALEPRVRPIVERWMPSLASSMAGAVVDGMTARHVIPAFRRWRNGEIATLDDVIAELAERMRGDLSTSGNTRVKTIAVEWQNRIRAELDTLTRPICNRWQLDPGTLRLPGITIDAGEVAVPVDPAIALGNLRTMVDVVNGIVAAVVAMVLFGSGTALIATTGPLAPLIAFAVGAWALSVGKEEALRRARSASLPLRLRKLKSEASLVATLEAGAEKAEADLAAGLTEQFTAEFRARLTDDVAISIFTQLDAVAAEAELLIS
ncbi:MAG TPA: hypothetical protein VEZ42_01255 [Pseudonocardia sp.]|nr:hypothetical protein [Pseudonocardia sp.]